MNTLILLLLAVILFTLFPLIERAALILLLAVILFTLFPLIEHAASSPGTLTQLATSSVTTLPPQYQYTVGGGHGDCVNCIGGLQGRPSFIHTNVRPVMQRGVYFNNPSWRR